MFHLEKRRREMMREDMLTLKVEDSANYATALGISDERVKEKSLEMLELTKRGTVTDTMLHIWNHPELSFEEKVLWTWKAGEFVGGLKAFALLFKK